MDVPRVTSHRFLPSVFAESALDFLSSPLENSLSDDQVMLEIPYVMCLITEFTRKANLPVTDRWREPAESDGGRREAGTQNHGSFRDSRVAEDRDGNPAVMF